MRPKSLSATSIKTHELCPARWVAESVKKTPQGAKPAADLGTACHAALEEWAVSGKAFDPNASFEDLGFMFYPHYRAGFSDDERLEEGLNLLQTWYKRSHPLVKERFVSAETKEDFTLYVDHNGKREEITFNYIWDRAEKISETEYEIIDYKTTMIPMQPELLRKSIQARCYGLAAQIKWPQAERVWVVFDLLRYDAIGTVFTREENIATWRYLQSQFGKILDLDPNQPLPEKPNNECRFCIRKAACKAIRQVAETGGVAGLTDPKEVADKRALLVNAKGALDGAINEIDAWLYAYFDNEDILQFETDNNVIELTARRTRKVDPEIARRVIGPELVAKYGSIGVTIIDKMLKANELTEEQAAELKRLIRYEYGTPSFKVQPKNPIDDE